MRPFLPRLQHRPTQSVTNSINSIFKLFQTYLNHSKSIHAQINSNYIIFKSIQIQGRSSWARPSDQMLLWEAPRQEGPSPCHHIVQRPQKSKYGQSIQNGSSILYNLLPQIHSHPTLSTKWTPQHVHILLHQTVPALQPLCPLQNADPRLLQPESHYIEATKIIKNKGLNFVEIPASEWIWNCYFVAQLVSYHSNPFNPFEFFDFFGVFIEKPISSYFILFKFVSISL